MSHSRTFSLCPDFSCAAKWCHSARRFDFACFLIRPPTTRILHWIASSAAISSMAARWPSDVTGRVAWILDLPTFEMTAWQFDRFRLD